ncbi:MAG: DNA polymerase III subunit delta [Pseudomonadota bacterium]
MGRQGPDFCRSPDPDAVGALISGADAGQVASWRKTLTGAVLGPDAEDLSLTDLPVAEARKDAAAIDEALKARGFFSGRRVVVIDGGTDGLTKPLSAALDGVDAEDAFLIVTAGSLPARSSLRKLFEGHPQLAYVPFYESTPTPRDIETALTSLGVTGSIAPDAVSALVAIGAEMDFGSFKQFLETVAVHGLADDGPITAADVAALAPGDLGTDVDAFVSAVAGGQPEMVGPLLQKLRSGNATPVSVLIGLSRHFRMLLRAATAGGGPDAGLQAIRPPLWGPRRDQVSSQLRRWGVDRLEQANKLLYETDGRLRSAANAPGFAVVERAALRLSLMGRGR